MLSPKSLPSFVSKAHPLRSLPNEPEHYELDVPGDGTCLFYSVAFAYLLPSLNDKALFKERFVQLFGEEVVESTEENRQRLLTYDGSPEFIQRHSEALEVLVNVNLRQRVVDYMQRHPKEFAESISGSFEDYVNRMRNPALREWGSQLEIKALSELLKVHITVYERAGEEIRLAAQSEYGQAFPNRMYLVHTLTPEGLAMGAAAPRSNNHYHFLIARQLLDKFSPTFEEGVLGNPEKKGRLELNPEALEMHFERLQITVEEALQCHDFIGRPYDKKSTIVYNQFQDKIKLVLASLKKELQGLQEMLIRFQKNPNKILLTQLNQGWLNFEKTAKQELESLQKSAQQLNPPLPEAQEKYLNLLVTEVLEGFKVQPAANRDDWLRALKRKLLDTTLSKLLPKDIEFAPTCFISYAWGNARNTRRVHKIARDLQQAGVQVFLDIWDNTSGFVDDFIGLIQKVDSVILVGTPELMEKWENYESKGASRGRTGAAYESNVVVSELHEILPRLRKRAKNQHGIITLLLEGEHETSFPTERLKGLPSSNTDFRDEIRYIDSIFSLLVGIHTKDSKERLMQEKQILLLEYEALGKFKELQLQQQYQILRANKKQMPSQEEVVRDLKAQRLKKGIEWNLPRQDNLFIGRKKLLQELEEAFPSLEKDTKEIVAITTAGLGGVGKTWLALKYLEDQAASYTLRAWFSAENPAVLEQQYVDFAKKLGYAAEKISAAEARDYVKGWLSRNPGWLLVFDNAGSYKDIEAYLPKGQGHVLITSRYQLWPPKVKKLEVDVMNEEDALKLLRTLIQKVPEPEAKRTLVKALGYLPLAIAQAGAYIQQCGVSVAGYLSLYQKYQKEMLEDEHLLELPPEIKQSPVAITWRASFEAIRKANPHFHHACSLMIMCAYLSPEAIPRQLLLHYLEKEKIPTPELIVNQCLSQLKAYSLIQLEPNNGPLSLHRLVQTVIRIYHQIGALQKIAVEFPALNPDWYNQLLETVNDVFSSKSQPLENEALERTLFPHLEALVKHYELLKMTPGPELAVMLFDIAVVYLRTGNPLSTKAYLQRGLPIFEQRYGQEHVRVASTLVNLASAFGDLGDVQEKKRLLERALIIEERYYGKEHVEVASTLNNLATTFGELGNAQEQKRLLERALVIFERYYGKEHVQVASTLNNLANTFGVLGNTLEQKRLLERALVIQERNYGKEHVQVASTLNNLANTFGALGNTREQKRFLERALVIEERHYGKEHVQVAHTLGNLAVAYGDLGDKQEQKRLLECALVIQERHYGKEHVEVAHILGNLAVAYGDLGDTQGQKRLLECTLVIFKRHYGKEHVEVARILGDLAVAYGDLGGKQEQKRLLERALIIFEREYLANHPCIAKALLDLSQVYEKLQDFSHQKALLERALKIEEQHYGPNHPELISILEALGKVSFELKDFKAAIEFLLRSLALQKKLYGEKDPRVLQLEQLLESIRPLSAAKAASLPSIPVRKSSPSNGREAFFCNSVRGRGLFSTLSLNARDLCTKRYYST